MWAYENSNMWFTGTNLCVNLLIDRPVPRNWRHLNYMCNRRQVVKRKKLRWEHGDHIYGVGSAKSCVWHHQIYRCFSPPLFFIFFSHKSAIIDHNHALRYCDTKFKSKSSLWWNVKWVYVILKWCDFKIMWTWCNKSQNKMHSGAVMCSAYKISCGYMKLYLSTYLTQTCVMRLKWEVDLYRI